MVRITKLVFQLHRTFEIWLPYGSFYKWIQILDWSDYTKDLNIRIYVITSYLIIENKFRFKLAGEQLVKDILGRILKNSWCELQFLDVMLL